MFRIVLTTLLLTGSIHAEAQRTADLTDAKKLLDDGKASNAVIFLHGSDWNPSGEMLKVNAWDTPAFAKALPKNIVLTAVDTLEQKPNILRNTIKNLLVATRSITATSTIPTGKNGTPFSKRKSGGWLVNKDAPNPATEVLTLKYRPSKEVSLICLTALVEDGLPGRGPGRAKNGNFVITELELHADGNPEKLISIDACASYSANGLPSSQACDGKLTNDNGWSVSAKHTDHHLYLVPSVPIPAGREVQITIHSLHKSTQHTLGAFRIDGYNDPVARRAALTLARIERTQARNAALPASTSNYPAIICLDNTGQQLGQHHGISANTTPKELTQMVQSFLETRAKRDELLSAAEKATGEEQVKKYVEAYTLMQKAGVSGAYKDLHKKIITLDPKREFGCTWSIAFDFGALGKEQAKLQKDSGEQAALDYLDSVLTDPRSKYLTHDSKQAILLRKHLIYKGWKDHQGDRFNALKALVAIDPDSHIGIGAKGYIDLHGDGDPSIAFGWKPTHLDKLTNGALEIREGVALVFHKPAHYEVKLSTRASKKAVTVTSVSLIANGKEISRDTHTATLAKGADKNSLFNLTVPDGTDPQSIILHIELDVPKDHNHTLGRISVTPVIPADGEFGWK